MGRKYLILFLVFWGGVAAAQENLDTLWTRRIGGTGNDVFYAMARGNDGNLFVLLYHSGTETFEAGNYIFEYSSAGDLVSSVELPRPPHFDGDERLSINAIGDIEIIDNTRIYMYGSRGEVLGTEILQTNQNSDWRDGQYPHHFDRTTYRVYRISERKFVTNGYYHASGYLYTRDGPWGGIYDQDSSRFTHYIQDYYIETRDETQVYGWRVDSLAGGLVVKTCEYAIGENAPLWQRADTLPRPNAPLETPLHFTSVIDSEGCVWIFSTKQRSNSQLEAFFIWKVGRYDSTYEFGAREQSTFKYEFAMNGTIVGLGYRNAVPPYNGVRFDVVTKERGNVWQTQVVSALDSCMPTGFVVLDDNTVVMAARSAAAGGEDIILARTDTLAPGPDATIPTTVELLVTGPPAWGYRINAGYPNHNQASFDNICTRAVPEISGNTSARWSISRHGSRVVFTCAGLFTPETSNDTLWLVAPECLGGSILWTIDGTIGEIEGPYIPDGPYLPEGYVQQFFCRLEQQGVSVRFAVTGAPDMDALKVWRKPVGEHDSVMVGLVNAHAGQHVLLDDEATRGRTYAYYLLATDDFGRIWKVPDASDTIFVDGTVFVPTEYSLSAAYPNPFNAVTKFDYALPYQTAVKFRVYDITGRQVATLVDEFQQAGTYSVVFDASRMATGIYIYSFEAYDYSAHGKVLLLK